MSNKSLIETLYSKAIETLSVINPTLATKLIFKSTLGYKLDLKNPKALNEKLQYLKLNDYYNNPTITECVDKYRVRNYLTRIGYKDLLNDLVGKGFYENAQDINFDELPNRFVLKCNHDCGSVIVCEDKTKLDKQEVIAKLNKCLKKDFWKKYVEVQYKNVKKGIVAESYLGGAISLY